MEVKPYTSNAVILDADVCDNCRYYRNGNCHRYPAAGLTMKDGKTISVLPPKRNDDWCGEHHRI